MLDVPPLAISEICRFQGGLRKDIADCRDPRRSGTPQHSPRMGCCRLVNVPPPPISQICCIRGCRGIRAGRGAEAARILQHLYAPQWPDGTGTARRAAEEALRGHPAPLNLKASSQPIAPPGPKPHGTTGCSEPTTGNLNPKESSPITPPAMKAHGTSGCSEPSTRLCSADQAGTLISASAPTIRSTSSSLCAALREIRRRFNPAGVAGGIIRLA